MSRQLLKSGSNAECMQQQPLVFVFSSFHLEIWVDAKHQILLPDLAMAMMKIPRLMLTIFKGGRVEKTKMAIKCTVLLLRYFSTLKAIQSKRFSTSRKSLLIVQRTYSFSQ